MKFSIIIPSYNQGRFIRRTIESVLSQQEVEKEIFVFDGGSTDETLEVLKSFGNRIQWVSERDRGQTDAINKGLRLASGDIHCYLNSDDVFYPGALRAVVVAFEKYPDFRIIYGDADHIDEEDRFIESYYNEEWNFEKLLDVCYICQPAVFWRKEITQEYGIFDDSLNYAMDYEYWLRIGSREPFFYLKGIKLSGSRMYADNKTLSRRGPVHREILQVARSYTVAPYRWLRVFSVIEATNKAGMVNTKRYAQNLLTFADEFNIPIDSQNAAELARFHKS
jgi:glycosyltransferase involved in cell wall biosynthesis